jgi:signal transduction histidine kinase
MHAATLESSYAQLLQKNAELEAANLQLRQLDHLKSSFLGTISHELRTPLTSILGYGDMLAEGLAGPLSREQLEFVQTIRTNGEQLLRLILSLLDLSKLESGTLRMHRVSFPVDRTVRDAIATMLPTASRKGVTLSIDATEPVRDVPLDPDRLRQVFVNLLENAVKFTPAGGHVRVALGEVEAPTEGGVGLALLAPARRELEVRVADSGIGIPPHERARVFDPFYQVDQSSTRERGGAGLGLAIVRRIIDAHDGRIHIEGNTPRGAVFVVRIPICPTGGVACTAAAPCIASADSAAFVLPEAACRDWLQRQLQDAGVNTIIYYPIPIHRQPAYAHLGYGPGSLPVTERLCSEVLSLPIFPELTEMQQQRVVDVLSRVLATSFATAVSA